MELLSVFFALAAIVLLYFSNRLYVKNQSSVTEPIWPITKKPIR